MKTASDIEAERRALELEREIARAKDRDVLDAKLERTRPTHYKVVCHSMYTSDLDALDRMVAKLKSLGWHKANRSHLIRIALGMLTVDDLEVIAAERKR